MNATIFEAAAALQRKIHAPAGAVSTIAQTCSVPQYIRVLVDPMYWHAIEDVPQEFDGYVVRVEKREALVPFGRR
jgi:hypothetical protein